MANLQDNGFRFVRRADGSFTWVHPLEVRDTDEDCTEMDDDEFERFVVEHA